MVRRFPVAVGGDGIAVTGVAGETARTLRKKSPVAHL